LPVGGEGIKAHISNQDDESCKCGAGVRMIVSGLAQEESCHAHGDEHCDHVLVVLVLLVAHHLPHRHNGYHLARLRQHLGREADVL